jgi:hypothetical protein
VKILRKAQGGMNAAILVAVIAGLILVYILFLPEAEREALLENKTVSQTGGSSGDDDDGRILLREFPGRLDVVEGVIDKTIPNIFLFESTDAKELEKINPIIVRNGVFDKRDRSANFGIDDLEDTEDVILAFNVGEHEGILTIKLNGQIIFEKDIEPSDGNVGRDGAIENVGPVRLNKNLLDNDNTLEFGVSSVGFKFWKTNEYTLENIRVIGDITDRSKQESRNIFTLTSKELFNIEKVDLRFVPYCRNVADVGVLDVEINSRNVFSAVPVCEDAYRQQLPVGLLNSGENKIIFKTNKGSYSVEQIKVEFAEKDVETNVYFFEVNQSVVDDIEAGDVDVVLTVEFTDDKENKRADLDINDRLTRIDDDERTFTKILNDGTDLDFVKEGNNFIEIEPRNRLDILEIKVEIRDT